ncbi:hypothetical protein EVJ58_g6571 [Rhodofomes roseus]|uniref:Thiaminase-2/PQQC domain-containing protein n=1 Tax=Rhodofomes roseus TaxID=34475 RepID=A0A4Y9YBG2_9APHY|nr:hypothetical protein EVJ58_g6571 [Rhodofomes roseus]
MHFRTFLCLGLTVLYVVTPSSAVSARARLARDRLRKYAAHPEYGVPEHEIAAVARKRALSPRQDAVDPHDLVARLIQDNQDIWQQLLHNPFIEAMMTAQPGNETVTAGYQWYEVQDYWYCIRLLAFDVERSFTAQSLAELNSSLSDVASDGAYALSSIQVTTSPPPAGLGLNESVVLNAPATAALNQYTDFQFVAAKDYNWVVSLAAQIPCIQSYYYIAEGLLSTSFSNDTLWYEQWVLPNLDYSYLEPQIDFFIANYDYWKDYYEDITLMFRKATLSEYNLWQVAFQPGNLKG